MKRIVVVVAVISYLFLSYSTKAEDHGAGTGSRSQVVEVPKLDAQSRLNELVSACFAGRPFPARQTISKVIEQPVTPAGPSVDSGAPTISNPVTPGGSGGGSSTGAEVSTNPSTPPGGSGGGSTAGRDAVARNCVTCHHASSSPDSFKAKAAEVTRRINLPNGDPQHMPQNATLSVSDKQAILDFVNGK